MKTPRPQPERRAPDTTAAPTEQSRPLLEVPGPPAEDAEAATGPAAQAATEKGDRPCCSRGHPGAGTASPLPCSCASLAPTS